MGGTISNDDLSIPELERGSVAGASWTIQNATICEY
jgi:hypothetical protein